VPLLRIFLTLAALTLGPDVPPQRAVELHARFGADHLDPDVAILAAAMSLATPFNTCQRVLRDDELYLLAGVLLDEAHIAGWGVLGAYFLAAMVEGESGCDQWAVGGSGEVCILQIIPTRYERPPPGPLQEDVGFCVRTSIGILNDYRHRQAWGNRGKKRWWWGHYNGGNYCVIGYAQRVAYRYRSLLKAAGIECQWWDEHYPFEDEICRRR